MYFKVSSFLVCTLLTPIFAYNYSELHWKKIETDHFVIHFHQDEEQTLRKVVAISDEVFNEVTSIYQFKPKSKTHVYLRDDEDTSNGFAVYNLNMLTIWSAPSQMKLRGHGDWIRGVFTHEFSHIVSLQAGSPIGMFIEGFRFGAIFNGNSTQNTNVGTTFFFPASVYSRWWAEGTAQLDTEHAKQDPWDTSRDMLLRSAVLENNLLSFDQMRNITVRNRFGGEMVYNQGFAFLKWLSHSFKSEINAEIARESGKHIHFDFDACVERATKKTIRELHAEWLVFVKNRYQNQVAELVPNQKDGSLIKMISDMKLQKESSEDRPYAGVFSASRIRFSPDGLWLSYISDGKLVLKALKEPYLIDDPNQTDTSLSKPKALSFTIKAQDYSWSPDQSQIVVSRRASNKLGGYPRYELYKIDVEKITTLRKEFMSAYKTSQADKRNLKQLNSNHEKELRKALKDRPIALTHNERATHPSWSPNGDWIAYSSYRDGHRALKMVSPASKEVKTLLDMGSDTQAFDPTWSPDSSQLAFTWVNHGRSDLLTLKLGETKPTPITLDAHDDRDPTFSADGKQLYFSSDRSGIFQIYSTNLLDPEKKLIQVTQVQTGAFMPFLDEKHLQMLYLRFSSFGFKPYKFPLFQKTYPSVAPLAFDSEEKIAKQLSPEVFPEPAVSRPEGFNIRPPRVFPTFLFENDQLKAGASINLADQLQKHELNLFTLFGKELDLTATYFNRMLKPTLFLSYTAYVRNNTTTLYNDGDGISDDASLRIRDDIQFINAGLSQDFKFNPFSPVNHLISLQYNRRFVDRELGVPLLINDQLTSKFRLLTNDAIQLNWNMNTQAPSSRSEHDINPQNVLLTNLSYGLIHTKLFSPDTTIPGPNQNYFHHDIQLNYKQYVGLPVSFGPLKYHTWWFGFNGGWKSRKVNANDKYYLGGRLNYRAFGQINDQYQFYGYPAFSISGDAFALASAGYTLPLARAIHKKMGWIYFDSLYGSFFFETGNAWDHGTVKNSQNNARLLSDVGIEFKLKSYLFNDWNRFCSFFRVAYGFQDKASHGFQSNDNPLQVYLGIGTDFN